MAEKAKNGIPPACLSGEGELPVAVIFGGAGYEHKVSVESGLNFLRAAVEARLFVLPIFINKSGEYFICTSEPTLTADGEPAFDMLPAYPVRLGGECGFLCEGSIVRVRAALPVLHGDFGEDGVVQGALIGAGIPVIGCDNFSGAVCADKAYTKWIAASLGIPTLRCAVMNYRTEKDRESFILRAERELGYPLFIKPCRLGSSVGAGCARDADELRAAVSAALSVSPRIMAEPMLCGKRELECAYLSAGGRYIITEPGEVALGADFYSYEKKYSGCCDVCLFPKARLGRGISERIRGYTARLAAALGIGSFARFDYFLSDKGEIYFNEINTVPGMTSGSLYSAMLEAAGVDFPRFAELLLGDSPK
ncbi:MAG: hypothetical protein IKD45_05655 [Clostridia bacterium]|nr:hypothetical protein [Clostridia bacterium]